MLAAPARRRRGRGRRCRARRPVRAGRPSVTCAASASTSSVAVRRAVRARRRATCRCRTPLGAWLLDEAGFAGTRVGVGPGRPRRSGARRPARARSACSPWATARPGATREGARLPGRRRRALRRRRRRRAGRRGRRRAGRRSTPAEGERLLAAGVPTWRAVGAALAGRAGRRRGCTRRRAVRRRLPGRRLGGRVSALPPVVAVVGPTATGKTALAVALAQPARRRGGQRRLDAALPRHGHRHGQARRRPSAAACRTTCSTCGTCASRRRVAEYRRRARAEIDRLRAAGAVPLLVGGSGLYVRAVLDELDFPGTDAGGPGAAGGGAGRGRARRAARPAGRARPGGRPRRSCPATDGGSCARWRSSSSPGGPFRAHAARAARRTTRRSSIGLDREPAELDERIARPGGPHVGRRLRRRGARRWPPTACARARRPSRALGYAQVLAQFDGALTAERGAGADGRAPPAGSSAGSGPGSAATPPLTWFDAGRADLARRRRSRVIGDRTIER